MTNKWLFWKKYDFQLFEVLYFKYRAIVSGLIESESVGLSDREAGV
jgi:hypothetical protein